MPGKELTDEEFASLTELERDRVARGRQWAAEKTGYFKVQGTRPQTLSYGLTDSPAGQLAWIMEKFKEWTNAARSCPRTRSPATVCSPTCRCTGSPAPPGRRPTSITRPSTPGRCRAVGRAHRRGGVRRGLAIRRYGEKWHNIVHWSDFDTGGHFAAMETPQLLVDDIRTFFATVT